MESKFINTNGKYMNIDLSAMVSLWTGKTLSMVWSVLGISLTLRALRDELYQTLFRMDFTGWLIPAKHGH